MKNKPHCLHPATCFLLLSVAVALLSWVGSIYGADGVQNLFNAEGLRWLLRNGAERYVSSPVLPVALVLAPGIGLILHSGFYDGLLRMVNIRRRHLSRKERRALLLTLLIGCLYLFLLALLAWGPWSIVRSVTGTLAGSPLEQGLPLLLSIGFSLAGITYGYATDTYSTDRDVVCGMAYCFTRFAGYFVTLFFVVFCFMLLDYTGIALWAGLSHDWLWGIYILCSIAVLKVS